MLSMIRATPQAALKAKSILEDSVKNVSFENSQKTLDGGNRAAAAFIKHEIYEPYPLIVEIPTNLHMQAKALKE